MIILLFIIIHLSLATYNNREKVAEKQKRLKERKEKLASLLTGEREQYEVCYLPLNFV